MTIRVLTTALLTAATAWQLAGCSVGGGTDPGGGGTPDSGGNPPNDGRPSTRDAGAPDTGPGPTDGGPGVPDAGGGTDGGGIGACGLLQGPAPTESSVSARGTFTVANYKSGWTDSPDYGTGTVYYPTNASPPLSAVALVPGYTSPEGAVAAWGQFLASHGYVAMTIGTNSTSDQPPARAKALMAAIGTLKAEHTRQGSPLNGKLANCYAVMGHSMGGGGSLIAANTNSAALKAAIPLTPWTSGSTSFPNSRVPTLIIAGQSDSTAPVAQHAWPHYQGIPAATVKMYVEIAGGSHSVPMNPLGSSANDKLSARYGLSWMKVNVDGDARYRKFLDKAASGLSKYETTLP